MAGEVPEADELGRGEPRRDLDLSPPAATAPQAYEIDEHAGAAEPGAEAPHPRRADLSQCGELPSSCPRSRRRDPRGLARSNPLSQHGASARAQEGGTQGCRRLTAAGAGPGRAITGVRAAPVPP